MNRNTVETIINNNNIKDIKIITNLSNIDGISEHGHIQFSRKPTQLHSEYTHCDAAAIEKYELRITLKKISEDVSYNEKNSKEISRKFTLLGLSTLYVPYENIVCLEVNEYRRKSIDEPIYDIPNLDLDNKEVVVSY